MNLRFFNTLTRKKELFKPLKRGRVGLYTCGPTVYNYAHIGNLRTYIFGDILRRTLKFNGYDIKQVMNVTDVEDKIIKKSIEENKTIGAITKPYIKAFREDLFKLNIEKAERYPTATSHIKDIVVLVKKLLAKGFAYQGEDKSIYFNIGKFRKYGLLSKLNKRDIKIGARINSDEYAKEAARDFVLWKSAKPNEPSWPSPWGRGRPGWHIECSAMSMKHLGPTIDIHAGAVDLIFPHHENEIAQSESASGKPFVKYWIHGEHLLVDGKKMSKSLGNLFTLRDLENKNINPISFRYLVLTSHYRSPLNFTWESLNAAQSAYERLKEQIGLAVKTKHNKSTAKITSAFFKKFNTSINDDLNTPSALAALHEFTGACLALGIDGADVRDAIKRADSVLGLELLKQEKIPAKITVLARERELCRGNKQFVQADDLRKQIEALGYRVSDTPSGPVIRKK